MFDLTWIFSNSLSRSFISNSLPLKEEFPIIFQPIMEQIPNSNYDFSTYWINTLPRAAAKCALYVGAGYDTVRLQRENM